MSDLQLRDFARRAEDLVALPDLAELEARGRALHRRRRLTTGIAAAAACVVALVAITMLRGAPPQDVAPAPKPDGTGAQVRSYPGNVMEDVDGGTYRLTISNDPAYPSVQFTLPNGWNAWEGPNRFNGHAPGRSNDAALGHLTWYVGIVYLHVIGIATEPCGQVTHVDSTVRAAERALTHVPGHWVTRDAEPVEVFGYPATHFTLQPKPVLESCPDDPMYISRLGTPIQPYVSGSSDVWVVDVDGHPVVVLAAHSTNAPARILQEQQDVLDSTTFVDLD